MIDFCLLRYRRLLSVKVDQVSLIDSDTIRIVGSDFTYALEVRVNNVICKEFSVASDSIIVAKIPSEVKSSNKPIDSVIVYIDVPFNTLNDDMEFAFTNELRSSHARSVQRVIKLLLTTPGTDKFTFCGGGLLSSLTQVSLNQPVGVTAAVNTAIRRVLMQIQENSDSTDLSERILDIKAVKIIPDVSTLVVKIYLLISFVGATYAVGMTLNAGTSQ